MTTDRRYPTSARLRLSGRAALRGLIILGLAVLSAVLSGVLLELALAGFANGG